MEEDRRQLLVIIIAIMAGFGIATASSIPFLASLQPSAETLALATASIEVDLSHLAPGESMVVAWQNKPIWIIRRTQAMLDNLLNIHPLLRDPDSLTEQQPSYARNEYRSLNPEYLILIGLCTHLGCSPQFKPKQGELNRKWPGGLYCPCHGSKFDLAGRVMKNVPAPTNLKIPPYRFTNEHTVVIGENPRLV
ncbi:ubiquinol-cytochrome c reductase iron-sulfur subunit [Rickettsiella endosymbiont of Litargus connexus]|jgi:ubiquinol-cytochrome c reductase iron-sulfur subunit|uniref:ubiquinol-cytochrome c reductase iron-sulfur subunit n=1 Tax=Rickettsiella endosymbiont of Litargus connexus TaxID=3066237 RepID=UPI0027F97BC9|nr:ubiquinol-cytochrome c reductase iron-sulfur subunit [Gammaproteobacteria bacterium]MCH9754769.1 ubiquinol-cytochrome c reductase iron-sulfur subunit [Gammaproteobacteria bacterium]MDD4892991.1 ubiquinol-cytochrome c reductase iron-sulfur subunit [Candidatus Rickettsiella isopodorum]MDD5161600.1 ubiquinol-cytochrome c reductase iron-sulfur subunit [Candidatus Rickettsiella isopodorum]MDQ5899456.1 Ubiquinol-cytochrome c reductase iron-sulfur subunit [Pseudomonadota bacterium]